MNNINSFIFLIFLVEENIVKDAIEKANPDDKLVDILQQSVNLGSLIIENALMSARLPLDIKKQNFGTKQKKKKMKNERMK